MATWSINQQEDDLTHFTLRKDGVIESKEKAHEDGEVYTVESLLEHANSKAVPGDTIVVTYVVPWS